LFVPLLRQLQLISAVAVLAMAPLIFHFSTEGTWNFARQREEAAYSGRFYMAQAEAMTQGRLDVNRHDIEAECWERAGGPPLPPENCHGYFGLTPSIVRLPFLPILWRLGSALTPLYIGIALLLSYFAALRLLARSIIDFADPETRRSWLLGYFIVGAIALGPGGSLLFLSRPAVYEEAAAWGVAFFLLALDRVWSWHRTQRTRSLWFGVIFAIASANARPTTVSACMALGVVVGVLGLGRPRPRVFAAAICLSLLPLATAAGVFWLKLRSPFPDLVLNEQVPETPRWEAILSRTGGATRGLQFAPTELVTYFRPDGVFWQHKWPYANFAFPHKDILWLPPLRQGSAYVERMSTLTTTMPMPWIVNVWALVCLGGAAKRWASFPRTERLFAAGLFASAAAMIVLTVTTTTLANRYISDFFPMAVVGLAIGHRAILPTLGRRPLLGMLATVVAILLVAWSVIVTFLLTTRIVFF
jgi:hypothetical protein